MKKVVIINHYGVTPDLPGPTKNYEMAKFFSENYECKSEFWICGFSHYIGKMDYSLKGFKVQSKRIIGKFSVVKLKSTPYRKSSLMRQLNILTFDLIAAIKILLSKDIDYIIITIPPVTIFSVMAAKVKKIKIVADVEDLWPLFLQDMGMNNKFVIRYMEIAANYLYNSSDGIAAVSKGMLDFVKGKVNPKPMWVSPLGVNTEDYFNKCQDSNIIKNKLWKDDFKIIYLGVHGRANDLSSVLNTAKFFNDNYKSIVNGKKVSFIFIGDGDQKDSLIKKARELRLTNVFFENPVPGNLVADYLVHADICLTNLMKIESFKLVRPNKLFQYMALGKPIISGIWGEFQDIIEEVGSGIYIDFTNPADASNKLYNLIKDENKLNIMGQKGIKYIDNFGNRRKIFSEFYRHLTEDI